MLNINFRNAELKDYVAFNKVYVETAFLGCKKFNYNPKSLEEYEKLIEVESVVLMEYAGTVVGYAIVNAFDDGEGEIDKIFIMPEYQKRGFGRYFIDFIEVQFKKSGIKRIFLISFSEETDYVWTRNGYRSVDCSDEYEKILG